MKISQPLLKSADLTTARAQPPGTPAVALNAHGDIIGVGYRVSPQAATNPLLLQNEALQATNFLYRHQQSGALGADAITAFSNLIPADHQNLGEGLGLVGDVGGIVFHSVEAQVAFTKGDNVGVAIASIQTGEKALTAINRLFPNHYLSQAAVVLDLASFALSAINQARKETKST